MEALDIAGKTIRPGMVVMAAGKTGPSAKIAASDWSAFRLTEENFERITGQYMLSAGPLPRRFRQHPEWIITPNA